MTPNRLKIKDVYIGSLDAKDDFKRNNKEFIENFLLPKEFDVEEFLASDKVFIEGQKGTGKTALIYYSKSIIDSKQYPSDILLFKTDFDDVKKGKIESQNNKIISIDRTSSLDESNFTYIWRLIFLSKILKLNEQYNYCIYDKTPELDQLTREVQKILKREKKNPFKKFLGGIKLARFSTSYQGIDNSISLEFEIDDEIPENLNEVIDDCMELFKMINLNQCSIQGYIFIDELEAYYENDLIFTRDLTLIRDLAFTVKEFSEITYGKTKNIKFVCAIRSEMIDSINRHISSKELNKSIYSFRHLLKWNYTNSTAINHPIFQIWLKRIKTAESRNDILSLTDMEIFNKWFEPNYHDKNIVDHILHHTWNKPRDIIRFMQCAKNVDGDSHKYNQTIFSNLQREYSKESWKELSEELNANFTKKQIDEIRQLLAGFISKFITINFCIKRELTSLNM